MSEASQGNQNKRYMKSLQKPVDFEKVNYHPLIVILKTEDFKDYVIDWVKINFI